MRISHKILKCVKYNENYNFKVLYNILISEAQTAKMHFTLYIQNTLRISFFSVYIFKIIIYTGDISEMAKSVLNLGAKCILLFA